MKVVDLFAGCGGLSYGFKLAGFETLLALERDQWASETYQANHPYVNIITGDITQISDPQSLVEFPVDGVIGGPPCQGYSLSGNRDPKDPRNSLFMDFIRFVNDLRADFFVMENVAGILSMKTRDGIYVKDIIFEEFEAAGYSVDVKILNAANYGVPQSRNRVFFIGVSKKHPFNSGHIYPKPTHNSTNYVTLGDAISDLPLIGAGSGDSFQAYESEAQNEYQVIMRDGSDGIYNHVAMRHTQRLIDRFSSIGFGESVKHAPPEHAQRKRGDASCVSGKAFSQNNMRPYPNRPCPTVPASFQSNFIHPYLNRNFTAREGARIQSFPDKYIFKGKRTTMSWEKNLSQYQQIGNAVPPLLSFAIAKQISWYFDNISKIVPFSAIDTQDRQLTIFE